MATSERVYTMEEVAQHNSLSAGVWLAIDGRVYDVTQFVDEHPGGDEVLLDNAGKDATNNFRDVGHSEEAIKLREGFLIGKIGDMESPIEEPPLTNRARTVVGVAAGLLLPALTVAALAIGAYFIYQRYKK